VKQSGIVVKISNATSEERFLGRQYTKQIVFRDAGSVISFPTTAVVDVVRGKSLIGGVLAQDIAVLDGVL
jgi:hypothetical protein